MAKTSNAALSRNFFHNGALDYWQRIGSTTTTINTATTQAAYLADRIQYTSSGATVKNYSIVRSSDVPTSLQSGFSSLYSQLYSVLTPIASFAAGDRVSMCQHFVEGFDYANLHGKTCTLQFWIKASATGTYSVSFRNAANNRSYVTTFTVSAANTWEFKFITLRMDTAGSWNFDFNAGLVVNIADFCGTTQTTSTLNAWQAGAFVNANTATNYYAAANTVRIAQVGLFLGSGPQPFSRAGGSLEQELAILQRYFETNYPDTQPGSSISSTAVQMFSTTTGFGANRYAPMGPLFRVKKRTGPVVTFYAPGGTINSLQDYSGGTLRTVTGTGGINLNTVTYIQCSSSGTEPVQALWTADCDF